MKNYISFSGFRGYTIKYSGNEYFYSKKSIHGNYIYRSNGKNMKQGKNFITKHERIAFRVIILLGIIIWSLIFYLFLK